MVQIQENETRFLITSTVRAKKLKEKKSSPNDIVAGNIREFWIWGGERLRVRGLIARVNIRFSSFFAAGDFSKRMFSDLTCSFCAFTKQKDTPKIFILLFFTKKVSTVIYNEGAKW